MKKLALTLMAISSLILFSGCIGLSLGGGSKSESHPPTLGQQLIDLKTAKDTGALSDTEYQSQKAKLLAEGHK